MPSDTLWPRESQTESKHLVLRSYLDGWLPILGSWSGHLLFIDGFAGPGECIGGEPGSPIIALECIKEHRKAGRLQDVEVTCIFVEAEPQRARHLESLLGQWKMSGVSWEVVQGEFDDHMSKILDQIDEHRENRAPTFVMIDPFGVKGSPMHLIERILRNDRSECMISFMYEPIRRFHEQREFETHLNGLFGTTDWQKCLEMEEAGDKKRFLHTLFREQLKTNGAKHVIYFELWKENRHVYTIYFTTGHEKGCNLMKQAVWKADPTGGYSLRGHTEQKGFSFGTDTEPLVEQLRRRFGQKMTPVEEIEAFVMSDETMFHTGQLRRDTLQPLERNGRITVHRPQGVRGFSSGKGIRVRFN